jgi:hypothetical protein
MHPLQFARKYSLHQSVNSDRAWKALTPRKDHAAIRDRIIKLNVFQQFVTAISCCNRARRDHGDTNACGNHVPYGFKRGTLKGALDPFARRSKP